MKKLAVLLLTMAMGISLIACGRNNDNNNESSVNQESTQDSENLQGSSEQVSSEGTEEVPDESMEEVAEPSEAILAIRNAVADALGENYWPQMSIPAEYFDAYGLTADLYDEIYGEMPMISTNVDTLIIADAAEGQLEALEAAMNAYRETLVNDTMQYPMNIGKIQASEVVTIGDYVCFVQLGADVTTPLESGDEAVIKHCEEQNAIAVDALKTAIGVE